MHLTGFLNKLIQSGYKVKGVPNYERWMEIDSENDLMVAHRLLGSVPLPEQKDKKSKNNEFSKEGGIFIKA